MSTLHQCHWFNRAHCETHLPLLGPEDALVVYGQISQADLDWLQQQLQQRDINWHLVIEEHNPHNAANRINHQQWLNMILAHRNTWTWK